MSDANDPQPRGRLEQLERLLRLCEREMKLLAFELHDGPVQHLVAALMHLEAAAARMTGNAEQIPASLQQGTHLVRAALQNVRHILEGIRPAALDAGGLSGAIRDLVTAEVDNGLQIQLDLALTADRLLPSLESAAYRIVQEALRNVRRHSGVTRAEVALRIQQEQLEIVVRDRGQGFDPARVAPDRLGLRGIRERARLFEGTATIDSRPGQGTCVHVLLPLRDRLLLD
jgi:signal transduction histidine kinase